MHPFHLTIRKAHPDLYIHYRPVRHTGPVLALEMTYILLDYRFKERLYAGRLRSRAIGQDTQGKIGPVEDVGGPVIFPDADSPCCYRKLIPLLGLLQFLTGKALFRNIAAHRDMRADIRPEFPGSIPAPALVTPVPEFPPNDPARSQALCDVSFRIIEGQRVINDTILQADTQHLLKGFPLKTLDLLKIGEQVEVFRIGIHIAIIRIVNTDRLIESVNCLTQQLICSMSFFYVLLTCRILKNADNGNDIPALIQFREATCSHVTDRAIRAHDSQGKLERLCRRHTVFDCPADLWPVFRKIRIQGCFQIRSSRFRLQPVQQINKL